MIGKTLAHYEISSLLGKGGMGEVYRAKDQKLGRDVAIKVLPEEFAKDADRVARFQREAKLLASLNHNNIASIYGLEESDGTHFLVLELVEGDTLADRLKHGAIPVEESLKLALQIAEALEAAHEKGVIHRDLKPANLKVTPDGKVKVLDFGLAKAFAGDQEDVNLSNSPTLSVAATQQGVILGTAAYMSPEQAKGRAVDKRTDVWAFGCVLFEMLTGRSVFAGDDVSQTLARVLERQPDFSTLPPNLHPKIIEMLERCLEKKARDRYSGISDARVDIQKALADPGGVFALPASAAKSPKMPRIGISWLAAALAIGAILAGVAVWKMKPTEPRRVIRFVHELPEGQQFNKSTFGQVQTNTAVSPDGSQFVYGTTKGLYVRPVETLDARLLAGTDINSVYPFFSPDGQWIGYWSQSERKLKKAAVNGSVPVVLCDTSQYISAVSWDADDAILYYDSLNNGITRVSASGGIPEPLIKTHPKNAKEESGFISSQILPDGKTMLFTKSLGFTVANSQIGIQSLESGEQKILLKSGVYARYLPPGYIIYALPDNNTYNLFAVRFDLEKLEVTGSSIPILEGVSQYSISDEGTLVYMEDFYSASNQKSLVWVDREGKETPIEAPPNGYDHPGISPDGTKVALNLDSEGNADIWIWDFVREIPTRLTFDEAVDVTPLWTLDGQRILFGSLRNGESFDVYWKAADGTGNAEELFSAPEPNIWPLSWSSDGKSFLTSDAGGQGIIDIAAISMEGDRERKLLLAEKYKETQPQISPDGRWLAYMSDESGEDQIYIRPFPELNKGKEQISASGGRSPLWSPDGKELFYRAVGSNMGAVMAVSIETEPALKPGKPRLLFSGPYDIARGDGQYCWDIHPDGRRFLMIKPAGITDDESPKRRSPRINVVVNWFEELKERVPAQ